MDEFQFEALKSLLTLLCLTIILMLVVIILIQHSVFFFFFNEVNLILNNLQTEICSCSWLFRKNNNTDSFSAF